MVTGNQGLCCPRTWQVTKNTSVQEGDWKRTNMHHTVAWSWLEMLLIAEECVYCIRFDR